MTLAACAIGTHFGGTTEVLSQSAQAEVDIITLTSNGIMQITRDTASTLSQTAGAVGSDTYAINSDGTFRTGSSGGAVVGVAISGRKFAIVNNPTLMFPVLQIGQRYCSSSINFLILRQPSADNP